MSPTRTPARRPTRPGVTAIESLLSVAIVAVAGSALLAALGSAVMSSREVALVTVAQGLADQLLDEAASVRVRLADGSAPPRPIGPRSGFLIVDHFDGWSNSPPQDRLGRTVGTEGEAGSAALRATAMQADAALLAQFRREVTVERVGFSGGRWEAVAIDTPFRRITVRVSFTDGDRTRELVSTSRIVCHVEPSP